MTEVTIFKDSKGIIRGFELKGHAGFANKGSDIVCSALSVLSLNTVNSVEKFTEDGFKCEQNEKKGELRFMFDGEPSENGSLLMKSFELGISDVAEEAGHRFVKFEIREV